ncbi:cyanamide hydratase [Suhomyces tanzawaensis NRRL Y-17324]|uniref:cyanamide hydratase n=1 Tax=Suhomyces tanzawaensis NRRL Y-17324 TaxID=984487 RepID=A0A1E4SCB7_9ASCO|nr:cyanamide hydratase [Suhomyces tanzawaensis NRRL Y-17324]ODV77118.1 cyanamide hydratase [Suhomyces tanzawaensis NRRL Y-17324]
MSHYGFVKISRDVAQAIPNPKAPTAQTTTELPQTPLASFVHKYAQQKLPAPVFNHSLRVYLYSLAIIKDQFPEWNLDTEVIYVTSLLHDIGTTDENMNATKMSFETYGGIISRDLVLKETGDKDYADAVAEAIVRHQDLGESGFITTLGLILQIATILDNVGLNSHLIHPDTLDAVNKKFSREGWLNCFAGAIDRENREKPWGHTSALGAEDFRRGVLGNKLKYEKL